MIFIQKNYLKINNANQIYQSNKLPFYVVTSCLDAIDSQPGNGNPISTNGKVTLRSAIQEANAFPGEQFIYFYIKEVQPIIQPLSGLPIITSPLTVDGTFQPGYTGSPLVKLGGNFSALTVNGGGTKVNGIEINNPSTYGLTLNNLGNNIISNNKISGISINSSSNSINGNTRNLKRYRLRSCMCG